MDAMEIGCLACHVKGDDESGELGERGVCILWTR
jgi:hypothetical protein